VEGRGGKRSPLLFYNYITDHQSLQCRPDVCNRAVARNFVLPMQRILESGVGFLERGSQPPLHQLEGFGSAVRSPSGIRGSARPPNGFHAF